MPVGVFPMPDSEVRAGLLFGPCDYEYSARSVLTLGASSGDGDPTYSHSADLHSLFAPDAIDLALGVTLQASSGFDGTDGSWSGFYDGPCAPFGGLSAGGDGFRSTVQAKATFRNLRLYAMEYGLLRVSFDGVDVDLGAGVVSLGPAQEYESAGIGPNYVPVFGIPPTVSGAPNVGRANTTPWSYDPCDPSLKVDYAWTTAASQAVSGGWRWNDGTGWRDCPVQPYSGAVPDPGGCPFGLSPPAIPAGRTYGPLLTGEASASYDFDYLGRTVLQVEVLRLCTTMPGPDGDPPGGETTTTSLGVYPSDCYDPCAGAYGQGYTDLYRTTSSSDSASGSVTLVPSLARDLRRFAPGYAKLLRRLWFPATTASLSHSCSDEEGGVASSTSGSSSPEVHPGLGNDFLGLLRDADAPVLDPFDFPAYAPCSSSRSQSHDETYVFQNPTSPCVCPPRSLDVTGMGCGPGYAQAIVCRDANRPVHHDVHRSESAGLSFPSSVGPSGDYQGHAEPLARYCATWPNPFWHLMSHRQDWYLQGTDAPWAPDPDDPTSVGYWGPVRTQWLRNATIPSLPSTRSDMIGDPYHDWAYTPVFDRFTGGLPWLGISRFKVREVGFPESVQLTADSSPMLSCPDESCTIAVSGGNVVLAPSGSGPITLDVDLVRADCFPFYGLLLAKSVRFASWSGLSSIRASLRSSLGGSADLNGGDPLSTGTDYAFPRGQDAGYAGTWGSDSGGGYLDDAGTDVAPGGDSGGHMANPETLAGFQGLRGLQGSVLRLTIQPTGGAVTLSLPLFKRVQGHPAVRWLDGNKAVLLWPDGPAVLWGAHLTYVPDEGLHWPWLPKGLGTPNTLADALQWIYAIFEMTDPGDVAAFNAECDAWYDAFEVSLRNVGSADKFSFSLLLPKGAGETIRMAICQTVAEVPPLACFPTLQRGTDDWRADGDPAMERWDQSQETRYVVSPVGPLVLKDPGGTTISIADSAPSGWAIQRYVLPLTGDESDDYPLDQGGTTIARVYPWHGWDWVGQIARIAKSFGLAVSRNWRHMRAIDRDGLAFDVSTNLRPFPWSEGTGLDSADWATLAYAKQGRADLPTVLYGPHGGPMTLALVQGEGESLLPQFTVPDADYGAHAFAPNGDLYVFRLKAGTAYVRVYDALLSPTGPEVSTTIADADDAPLQASASVGGRGDLRIHLQYLSGGSVVFATSPDGRDFS